MKQILFWHRRGRLRRDNGLFNNPGLPMGDNLYYPWAVLREAARRRGVKLATSGGGDWREADAYVFIDMPPLQAPFFQFALQSQKPLYLIVWESPLYAPTDFRQENHRYFQTIFTYDDRMADGSKYIKLNYAFQAPEHIPGPGQKDKLCAMIAMNKVFFKGTESARLKKQTIRWFEKTHPEDFDLYGHYWHIPPDVVYNGQNQLLCLGRLLYNKSRRLRKLWYHSYPSDRGRVELKIPVLARYCFTVCYENVFDLPGYITEKIFDAFFAGTVPIYRGADNVTDYIPAECFIDRRNFAGNEELYRFIKTMPDTRYHEYLAHIAAFLKSGRFYPFSVACFVETLLQNLIAPLM
jgi:hypothetical protein